eukprot:31207-Pelagococcus_subviridis.AAC.9
MGRGGAVLRDVEEEGTLMFFAEPKDSGASSSHRFPYDRVRDFSPRRLSPPTPRSQSRRASTPFNLASDAFDSAPTSLQAPSGTRRSSRSSGRGAGAEARS